MLKHFFIIALSFLVATNSICMPASGAESGSMSDYQQSEQPAEENETDREESSSDTDQSSDQESVEEADTTGAETADESNTAYIAEDLPADQEEKDVPDDSVEEDSSAVGTEETNEPQPDTSREGASVLTESESVSDAAVSDPAGAKKDKKENDNTPAAEEPEPVITDGTETGESDWGAEMMGLDKARRAAIEDGVPGKLTIAVVDTGVSSTLNGRVTGGKSYLSDNSSYLDDPNGHGTIVAKVIADNTPDNVDIVMLQALNKDKQGGAGAVAAAIRDAYREYDADIINLSLAVSRNSLSDDEYRIYTDELREAVDDAINHGCLVVVSAGNDRSDISEIGCCPANIEGCITVSAVDRDGNLYEYSNYGSSVDFCAPGSYDGYTGTSIAAPYISAALSLLKLYEPDRSEEGFLNDFIRLSEGDNSLPGNGMPVFEDGYVPRTILDHPYFNYNYANGTLHVDIYSFPDLRYDIYRREKGEGEFKKIGTTQSGQFEDTGVEKGHIYEYYVECTNNPYHYTDAATQTFEVNTNNVVKWILMSPIDPLFMPGEIKTASVSFYPENAVDRTVHWSSEDPEIASVNDAGEITAHKMGLTRIMADTNNGKRATLPVTVVEEGKCGEDVYWSFDEETGTLDIHGTGDMLGKGSTVSITWPWNSIKDRIHRVHIADGVTGVGARAFYNYKLEEVSGMRDVREIGNGAFSSTVITDSLMLPVNAVFDYFAFDSAKIGKLIIPKESDELDIKAFGTANIQYFDVEEGNAYYSSDNGVLFSKDGETLLRSPINDTEQYTIPATVRTIADRAFYKCQYTKIDAEDGVRKIGISAFMDMPNLQSVTLPDTVTELGSSAFQDCRALENITLSSSIEVIPLYAFERVGARQIELPAGLKMIDVGAFFNSRLEEIQIPEGVEMIGFDAFQGCHSLKKVTLPGTLRSLRYYASYGQTDLPFMNCNALEEVTYSGFTANYEDLILNAVQDDPLRTVELTIDAGGVIPDSGLTWRAEGPSGDLTLTISGTGPMPDYTSSDQLPWKDGRDEITHIVIEEGVTHLGSYAFSKMKNLVSVALPESTALKENENAYGYGVFYADPALEVFTYSPADGVRKIDLYPQYLEAFEKGSVYKPQVIAVPEGQATAENNEINVSVSWEETTRIGQGRILIGFSGEYAGYGTVYLPFLIDGEDISGVDIKKLSSITITPLSFTYDGNPHTPVATVKSGNFTLVEGADYELTYSPDITSVGDGKTVTARGIGVYTGTLTAYFSIDPGQNDSDQDPGGKEDNAPSERQENPASEEETDSSSGAEKTDPDKGSGDSGKTGGKTSDVSGKGDGKDISDKEGSASPASQKTDDQRAGEEEDNKKKERAADGRTSAASSGSTAKPASSAQIDETADDGTTHRQEAPDAEDVDEGSSNGTAYDETDTVPGTDGSDQLAADTSQGMNPGMFILVLLGGAAVIGGIPVLWFFLIGKRNKDEEEEQQ